jgi:hypothetical protein
VIGTSGRGIVGITVAEKYTVSTVSAVLYECGVGRWESGVAVRWYGEVSVEYSRLIQCSQLTIR